METFITLPQLFIISGLLLLFTELIIGLQSGFDLVLIGSILILSGITGLLTGNVSIMLIIASVLSLAYILIGRNLIRQKITVITKKTNIDKLIGAKGIVIRSITPDTPGIIRLNDEDWRATSSDVLYEKDKVEVISIEGVTLHVTKVDKTKN